MTELPFVVSKCDNPILRAAAKHAFEHGTVRDQGAAVRAILAYNKETERQAKRQRIDPQITRMHRFLLESFQYMYTED